MKLLRFNNLEKSSYLQNCTVCRAAIACSTLLYILLFLKAQIGYALCFRENRKPIQEEYILCTLPHLLPNNPLMTQYNVKV